MNLKIPKRENLEPLKYEYIDRTIDQYYRLTTRFFMRKRLEVALSLLGEEKVEKILDAGCGGGTFIPTLAELANEVYGIDIHPHKGKVERILKREGVKAKLFQGSILKLPFSDNFFDKVVCLSVLEHFKGKELKMGIKELYRVVKPGGALIIGVPGKNPLSNFFIRFFLVFTPDKIHPSSHLDIIKAVEKIAKTDKIVNYPAFLPLSLAGFVVIRVRK